ncbi:conserved hypothetical protein [Burkholderiales bacterium 8X]|nr:conserved hypothetical protein [Burkholderiales bacterium 8X]
MLKFVYESALLAAVAAATLTACGGGGGGSGGGGGGFGGFGATDLSAVTTTAAVAPSTTGSAGSAGTTSTGVVAPAGSPAVVNSVVDGAGTVSAAAYKATASQMSKDGGLNYRYGPSAATYNASTAGVPTLFKRTDNVSRCNGSGQNCLTTWQVGGPRVPGDGVNNPGSSGLYSTNQANVTFVADNPAVRVGVGDLQVSAFELNTFSQSPQLPWQNQAAANSNGGLDSFTIAQYKVDGQLSTDGESRPVAAARCGGRVGFCSSSVVAFQNGLLGTAGSNTAHNRATVKLAANKVPTSIAMTNNSEFALVTVWDTAAVKGQLAVVALAGLCDGCTPGGPTYEWWNEWEQTYPGLPNMGNIAFMKVLGYVDLPDMKAPTEVAVTTGLDQFATVAGGGAFIGRQMTPLTDGNKRGTFAAGGANNGRYAKAGVAVVVSKEEQKVTFVDLKPLFNYVNNVYFGSGSTSTFTNLGQADNQWPHTFANAPQQMPTVIKTVTLDQRPTAVRTTVYGSPARAWVATQESGAAQASVRIFDLGGYASGSSGATGSAAQIAEKGRVAVGRNPTSLAISKGEPNDSNIESINRQVIVTSRGDRKVQWVRFAADGNSGSVVRELRDSRLVDPIAAEDIDNFANVGNTMSVADYDGKKLANYRYGPVIFADRGSQWACQPPGGCPVQGTGGVDLEFGGSFAFQGKPFHINASNVP